MSSVVCSVLLSIPRAAGMSGPTALPFLNHNNWSFIRMWLPVNRAHSECQLLLWGFFTVQVMRFPEIETQEDMPNNNNKNFGRRTSDDKPAQRSRKHLPDYKVNPVKVESRDRLVGRGPFFHRWLICERNNHFGLTPVVKSKKGIDVLAFGLLWLRAQSSVSLKFFSTICLFDNSVKTCAFMELHTCVDDDRTRTLREKSCSLDYLSDIVLYKRFRHFWCLHFYLFQTSTDLVTAA